MYHDAYFKQLSDLIMYMLKTTRGKKFIDYNILNRGVIKLKIST